MVKPTDLNVKGKVIVPLPTLVEAMANKSLTFNESDYKKALYAPAFGRLFADIQSDLKVYKNDNGKWVGNKTALTRYTGFAKLTSFETYKIIPCNEFVNFTLGEDSNWSRPFHFEYYTHVKVDPLKLGVQVGVKGRMLYLAPEVDTEAVSAKADMLADLDAQRQLDEVNMVNRRTTNAFIRKFGLSIRNPDLQSNLDTSSSLINSFTE